MYCNTREKLNNSYAKFWWANKVYYGRCANGEWAVLELTGTIREADLRY